MALISKNNRDWASKGEKAKWFCIIPMIPKVDWRPYPKCHSKTAYAIMILTNKEFKEIYHKCSYTPDKDGYIFTITKDMSLDEVKKFIEKSTIIPSNIEDYSEELIHITSKNIENFID